MRRLESAFAAQNGVRRLFAERPGRGYSRFVSLAKRVLPAIAVGLLLLVASWPRLQAVFNEVRVHIPRIDTREARNLRMVSVHYAGIDRQNRPFVVTAKTAQQMPKVDDLVSLDQPKADLTTDSGGWLELGAYTGIYQPQPQLLDLFGNVALFQDKGNEFHSDSARINMQQGTAEGDDPVTGQGPFGTVAAQGFRMLDRGDTIIFTGHTKMLIRPREKTAP